MEQPATAPSEPWTAFPKLGYSFIHDHFVHDHKGVLKVNLQGSKGGVEIKQIVNHGERGNSLSDQTKFWMALPGNRSFFAKLRTGQQIKVHYDNGNTEFLGRSFNLYGTLNFSRQLKQLSWRLGAAHFGKICHTDNRILIDTHDRVDVTWSNKTVITKGKFKYGLVAAYSFRSNMISKSNFLFGVDVDERTSIFLRAENQKFRNTLPPLKQWTSYFDHLLVDVLSQYDPKTKIGLQFAFQTHGKSFKQAIVVLERQVSEDWTAKAKLSTNFDVNLLLRGPAFFNRQNGKLSLGFHGSNLSRAHRLFKYGAQLQFNL